MIKIIRTDSSNSDFKELVKLLDKELAVRDGDEHAFYAQFNKTVSLKNTVVAYWNNKLAACGAFRKYADQTVEIKRMYTIEESRGHGLASSVLQELEQWATELNFKKAILETGKKQPEAISLYKKHNYQIIPNYGQYQTVDNSVCFEKSLI